MSMLFTLWADNNKKSKETKAPREASTHVSTNVESTSPTVLVEELANINTRIDKMTIPQLRTVVKSVFNSYLDRINISEIVQEPTIWDSNKAALDEAEKIVKRIENLDIPLEADIRREVIRLKEIIYKTWWTSHRRIRNAAASTPRIDDLIVADDVIKLFENMHNVIKNNQQSFLLELTQSFQMSPEKVLDTFKANKTNITTARNTYHEVSLEAIVVFAIYLNLQKDKSFSGPLSEKWRENIKKRIAEIRDSEYRKAERIAQEEAIKWTKKSVKDILEDQ